MKLTRLYTLAIFALLTQLPTDVMGQEGGSDVERERFFTTSLGGTWRTSRDTRFSPLSYSGIGAEMHTGNEKISAKWFKKVDIWGSINDMQSRVSVGYNQTALGFRYGAVATWARRIKSDARDFRWYLGGSFFHEANMTWYQGNVNNEFSFNVPTGVAATTVLQKNQRFLRRNWLLSTQFTMPVLVYNARPNYIGFVSLESLTEDFGILTLNKMLRFDWRWQADLPLRNGNRYRFIYRWDFLHDAQNGILQLGAQTLSVEIMFNMPYKKGVVSN